MKQFISTTGMTHSRRDLRFGHENEQLLCEIFYARIFFSARILLFSSRREYYQDFVSRQDSSRDPGGEVFSLAGSRRGQNSGRDSCKNTRRGFFQPAGSRRVPGYLDPAGIPVATLQGIYSQYHEALLARRALLKMFHTMKKHTS